MALMGIGIGTGENRIEDAVLGALRSPLLNDFDLTTAKNLLINITCGKNDQGLTMDELKEINARIADYTGNVNKFKTGLVWETDPAIGDQVKITAIATGFKVNDLSKITKTDLGNLIVIGKDFKFEKRNMVGAEEVSLPDLPVGMNMIGYNAADNVKRFHFDADKKPVLVVDFGQSIGELESVPAIKRMVRQDKENN